MKKHIPNMITCCNLICGCIAIYHALMCAPELALLWMIIGAAFDFFDGLSARALKVSSPIGKELDSLADDVTFGVAPATILFSELAILDYPSFLEPLREVLPFTAFILAAFSALRLAKFNLDERQTLGFIGLPTPANAIFWGALVVGYSDLLASSEYTVLFLLVLLAVSCWLLVCEVPMFALKFKHWGWREPGNALKYGSIAFALASLAIGQVAGMPVVVVAYVVLSIIMYIVKK